MRTAQVSKSPLNLQVHEKRLSLAARASRCSLLAALREAEGAPRGLCHEELAREPLAVAGQDALAAHLPIDASQLHYPLVAG